MTLIPPADVLDAIVAAKPEWHQPHPNPFAVVLAPEQGGFTVEECDLVLDMTERTEPLPQPHACEAEVVSFRDEPKLRDVGLHVLDAFYCANQWWNLHFDRMGMQALIYEAGMDYPLHVDMDVSSSSRKLAMTVQLSEPSDYDDGDLVIHVAGDMFVAPRERGTVIVFPTWTPHEITRVTRGTRASLVATAWGPAFQ